MSGIRCQVSGVRW